MLAAADLPARLALFPLPGAIVLPRSRLPLHIFEPRYLAMVNEALKTDHRLIGMIQPVDHAGSDQPGLQKIGCAGRITEFSETDDGRFLITLKGASRFRLVEAREGFHPYLIGDVEWAGFDADLSPTAEVDEGMDREAFMRLLERYFRQKSLGHDWQNLTEANDEQLINALSLLCPFAHEERQALLEAPHLQDRREMLTTLIEFSLRSGGDGGMLKQ